MDQKPAEGSRHPQGQHMSPNPSRSPSEAWIQSFPNADGETEANKSEPSGFNIRDAKERKRFQKGL